eukprot:498527-Amphidinium_carterae.2
MSLYRDIDVQENSYHTDSKIHLEMAKGFTAKKGKHRMVIRPTSYKRPSRPSTTCMRRPASSTPYTRSRSQMSTSHHTYEKDRVKCSMTMSHIMTSQLRFLTTMLKKMSLLDDDRVFRWKRCPSCNRILLKRKDVQRANMVCFNRACDLFKKVNNKNRVCIRASIQSIHVREQALMAFNFAIGIKIFQSVIHAVCNRKAAERIYLMIRTRLAAEVRKQQEDITFNSTNTWVDCECDEVTVRKRSTDNDKSIWTEYLGI